MARVALAHVPGGYRSTHASLASQRCVHSDLQTETNPVSTRTKKIADERKKERAAARKRQRESE